MSIRKPYPNELYHHGIKGQRWGVRRYQNPDGSLTAAGKKRREKLEGKTGRNHSMNSDKRDTDVTKRVKDDWNKMTDQEFMNRYAVSKKTYQKRVYKYGDPYAKRMGIRTPNDELTTKQQKRLAKERAISKGRQAVYNLRTAYPNELKNIK